MADRYWVGGAGTWDATTTTNWSASSGGAGGASAPTSVDNVIFNSLSNATAYAVTVGTNANAQDITIAGPLTGNVTITSGATAVINCYGSWTNAATGVVFTTTNGATINFLATTTGKTITTNNVTMGAMAILFNGVGGGWTLGSAFTNTSTFGVNNGAFSTGNYALTISSLVASTSATRSVSLGSSAISCSAATPINIANPTGLTLNAGTSTITITGINTTFNGGSLTYYNVTYSGTASGTSTIQGANTFNNLTQTSLAATGSRRVVFVANQTINGTLTLGAANTSIRRIQVVGTTVTALGIGTPITLTVAAVATLADVDFRDITAAGASGTWSGTRLGNAGGNSNITFGAGVNKYWNLAAGGAWSATAWALTSGGAVAANNFPLAQDTVIIEDTGLTAGNTVTVNATWFIGTINASTRTTAFTLASGTDTPLVVGSYNTPSVATITGTGIWYFQGVGVTQTITTNNVSIPFPINCNGSTANIVRLSGNLTTTNTVTLQQGTFDLNSNTLTTSSQFSGTGAGVRTIAFGATGKMVLTGTAATLFTASAATNLTVTGANPLIQLTTNATTGTRGITMGAVGEANAISVEITQGSDTIGFVTTSGAFKNISAVGFTGTLNFSNSIFVFGNFDAGGATALGGTGGVNFSATSGSYTVRSNNLTFPAGMTFSGVGGAWTLLDNLTLTTSLAFSGGTLNLGNNTISCTNVAASGTNTRTLNFGTGKIVVTATDQTVWTSSISTGLTMTGTRTVEVTGDGLAGETRTITGGQTIAGGSAANAANFYIKNGADTISVGTANRVYGTLDFTGFSGATLGDISPIIYGDLVLSTGMTVTGGSNVWIFAATTSQTITTNNKTIDNPVTFDGIGGTWTCTDALTIGSTRTFTMTNGTLKLKNGVTSTVGTFATSGTNQKFLQSSTPGSQATLSQATGTVDASYLTIQDSAATGGATWLAYVGNLNIDAGNNTGWTFFNNVYTREFTDSAAATDLNEAAVTFTADISDTTALSDVTDAAATFDLAISETAAISDQSDIAVTFNAAIIEATTLSDLATAGATFNPAVVDTATLSDSTSSAFLWNLIDDAQTPNWQNINTI